MTGWLISLLDHMTPVVRKKDNSADPGHVLVPSSRAPRDNPRSKFLCISESFSTKIPADSIGYERQSAKRWGIIEFRSVNRGAGGDVT